MQHSLWYVVPNTLLVGDLVMEELLHHQITDRQRIEYNIPQAVLHSLMLLHHQITNRQRIVYNIPQGVLHSLMLLKMRKIVARNMSS